MNLVTMTMTAAIIGLASPALASDGGGRFEHLTDLVYLGGDGERSHQSLLLNVRDDDRGRRGRSWDDDDDDHRGRRGRGRDDWDDRGDSRNKVQDGWLSIAEISAKMSESGLKVHKIEADDGRYEAYATDADGKWVKAYVNPKTGEIMHRRERSR